MEQLLDIDDLITENKRQENNRLSLFESMLTQCHKLIKKNNKERIREMNYTIPGFVFGTPKYNVDVLRNYIVWHLKDNGLRVDMLDRYHIYISWKETDIDLEKYMNRRTLIENSHSSIYMLERGPNDGLAGVQPAINREKRSRFEMMKYRQERQKQIQGERQHRFSQQRERLPLPDMSNHFKR
jgi:hypothetical protein